MSMVPILPPPGEADAPCEADAETGGFAVDAEHAAQLAPTASCGGVEAGGADGEIEDNTEEPKASVPLDRAEIDGVAADADADADTDADVNENVVVAGDEQADEGEKEEKEEKEEEEEGVVLTQEMTNRGLSQIGRSASGMAVVFLKLSLMNHSLRDVSRLSNFEHIQVLELRHNKLRDLSPLSVMKHLLKLDVSHNQLTSLLDFEPPCNLMEVDYSNNQLTELVDLSSHSCLKKLVLDFNEIPEMRGLSQCKLLVHLSIRCNRITRIENLDNMSLKHLNLSGNQLSEIENLSTLHSLDTIDLSDNKRIRSLKGLEDHAMLHCVQLANNDIGSMSELSYIKDLPMLRELDVSGNPIQNTANYRLALLFALQRLSLLDQVKVSAEQKVAAINMYNPPNEVVAALDHVKHITREVRKGAELRPNTPVDHSAPLRPLVLVGPSGAGKRTIMKRLLEDDGRHFGKNVGTTTRPPKAGEVNGVDYHFISKEQMEEDVEGGKFIETVQFFGHSYGTSVDSIMKVAKEGKICVMDMTLEGMLSLKKSHLNARFVMLKPPSKEEHARRLKVKGMDTPEEIEQWVDSMYNYQEYMDRAGFFDAIVINLDVEEALYAIREVVAGDIRRIDDAAFEQSSNPASRMRSAADRRRSSADEIAFRRKSAKSLSEEACLSRGQSSLSAVSVSARSFATTPQSSIAGRSSRTVTPITAHTSPAMMAKF